jgi:hypothetical protein
MRVLYRARGRFCVFLPVMANEVKQSRRVCGDCFVPCSESAQNRAAHSINTLSHNYKFYFSVKKKHLLYK